MKIRKGFVSNSSSSSFVCDVCGRTTGSYCGSLYDFDGVECENEHTFCQVHIVNMDDDMKILLDNEELECIPSKYCPICQMNVITSKEAIRYMHSKYKISLNDIKSEIKLRFKTYDEFTEFLKQENV